MKLSPEVLEELKITDSISKSYAIIDAIEERVSEIVEFLAKTVNRNGYWWAWSYYEKDENEPQFDINEHIHSGMLVYSLNECGCDIPYVSYDDGEWDLVENMPLKWLWDDYKEDLVEGIKRAKAIEASEKEEKANRRKELK